MPYQIAGESVATPPTDSNDPSDLLGDPIRQISPHHRIVAGFQKNLSEQCSLTVPADASILPTLRALRFNFCHPLQYHLPPIGG